MLLTVLTWFGLSFVGFIVCQIVFFVIGSFAQWIFHKCDEKYALLIVLACYTGGACLIGWLSCVFSPWFMLISIPEYFIIGFIGECLSHRSP